MNDEIDYAKVMVRKPWGYEYLMYQNRHVALWHLFIRHGEGTSVHCHPSKKTALIVLSGKVRVKVGDQVRRLTALGYAAVPKGAYHSTTSLAPEGSEVIEIESPPNKSDLVRRSDRYGRRDRPYEGRDSFFDNGMSIRLDEPVGQEVRHWEVGQCILSLFRSPLMNWHAGDGLMIVLSGHEPGETLPLDQFRADPPIILTVRKK